MIVVCGARGATERIMREESKTVLLTRLRKEEKECTIGGQVPM